MDQKKNTFPHQAEVKHYIVKLSLNQNKERKTNKKQLNKPPKNKLHLFIIFSVLF